ncbi:MAG: hypothetical protein RQ826_17050 [Xanthomonadales bacterium]|nr:hypothetical protein [Xanthomonadales bacterium]
MIVVYGLLLFTVVPLCRSTSRKRVLLDIQKWSPRLLFIGLVFLFIGINTLMLNVDSDESNPLIRWGWIIPGVFLIVMGLWLSIKMTRNWLSQRDSDGSAD